MVLSKKKNSVDISDLWKKDGINFNVCGLSVICKKNITVLEALTEWYKVHSAVLHQKREELGSGIVEGMTIGESNEGKALLFINSDSGYDSDELFLLKERRRSCSRAIA